MADRTQQHQQRDEQNQQHQQHHEAHATHPGSKQSHPGEWQQQLSGGAPFSVLPTSHIVVGGHDRGGGDAAFGASGSTGASASFAAGGLSGTAMPLAEWHHHSVAPQHYAPHHQQHALQQPSGATSGASNSPTMPSPAILAMGASFGPAPGHHSAGGGTGHGPRPQSLSGSPLMASATGGFAPSSGADLSLPESLDCSINGGAHLADLASLSHSSQPSGQQPHGSQHARHHQHHQHALLHQPTTATTAPSISSASPPPGVTTVTTNSPYAVRGGGSTTTAVNDENPQSFSSFGGGSGSGPDLWVGATKVNAMCRHHLEGKCNRGMSCRFSHGLDEGPKVVIKTNSRVSPPMTPSRSLATGGAASPVVPPGVMSGSVLPDVYGSAGAALDGRGTPPMAPRPALPRVSTATPSRSPAASFGPASMQQHSGHSLPHSAHSTHQAPMSVITVGGTTLPGLMTPTAAFEVTPQQPAPPSAAHGGGSFGGSATNSLNASFTAAAGGGAISGPHYVPSNSGSPSASPRGGGPRISPGQTPRVAQQQQQQQQSATPLSTVHNPYGAAVAIPRAPATRSPTTTTSPQLVGGGSGGGGGLTALEQQQHHFAPLVSVRVGGTISPSLSQHQQQQSPLWIPTPQQPPPPPQ